jgi:hypothetical protein
VTRLRLVPPGEVPDGRAAVAQALLGPVNPLLSNQALAVLGDDLDAARELEADPRFVIGRLFQALTALLEQDVPPMDATAQLLDEAIRDAIEYRQTECPKCPPEDICPSCAVNWRKAERYVGLYDALGVIGEKPGRRTDLKAVDR